MPFTNKKETDFTLLQNKQFVCKLLNELSKHGAFGKVWHARGRFLQHNRTIKKAVWRIERCIHYFISKSSPKNQRYAFYANYRQNWNHVYEVQSSDKYTHQYTAWSAVDKKCVRIQMTHYIDFEAKSDSDDLGDEDQTIVGELDGTPLSLAFLSCITFILYFNFYHTVA